MNLWRALGTYVWHKLGVWCPSTTLGSEIARGSGKVQGPGKMADLGLPLTQAELEDSFWNVGIIPLSFQEGK